MTLGDWVAECDLDLPGVIIRFSGRMDQYMYIYTVLGQPRTIIFLSVHKDVLCRDFNGYVRPSQAGAPFQQESD